MFTEIQDRLTRLETEHDVKILYACESGSRAWGFPSTDSDYDVRFIYVRKLNHYLTIAERKDVIEVVVDERLDIGGWDLRKALQLFLKSNAPLYEWLQSPVVYNSDTLFINELCSLMSTYFSLRAGCHHYLSMATNTFENDLKADQVKLKKYFYALRPALAALWIVEKKTVPPMQFAELRSIITHKVWQSTIDALLQKKEASTEKTLIEPVPFLHSWIDATLKMVKQKSTTLQPVKHSTDELDKVFRKHITT
jgi:uncharacterized protein